ncbi:peroxiredoxin [Sphingomonas sp. S1-29]|uniref:peroxiredoxin n=1 Tax=Sphingomonas sp. S1-29 TaxID=2991074 RepID=UPI00223F4D8A|nr:peroxiredoxin [Sphingomonas sp. S1-29]UZK70623.1 peroxiredoxin [Sphingomonas sp. S1-29]
MTLEPGAPIPDVAVTLPDGSVRRLADATGRALVVYFYPKDDTPGCTREAQGFSEAMPAFEAAGVEILGISKDPPAKHQKFAAKYALAVPLASDVDDSVCEAFGAWVEKSMYGKQYMGIDRSTFLFGADGRLVRAWRKVKVPGHVDEVLAAANALPRG